MFIKFLILFIFVIGVLGQSILFAECLCITKAQQTSKGQDLEFETARCQLESNLSECRNPELGMKSITSLSQSNYPKAQYLMGYWYMIGRVDNKINYAMALSLLTKASDHNVIAAYHDLGWLYETGNGTKLDLNTAEKLYLKAVSGGDIRGKLGLKRVELARLKLQYPHATKKKTGQL